jgi:hypothetical protein
MTRLLPGVVLTGLLVLPAAAVAQSVPGTTASNPLVETSAGRAWQRITFGTIDCGTNLSEAGDFCPDDVFTQTGVFENGTYRDLRFQYSGAPLGATPNAADFLANRVITQSQTFPQASSASGFTFTWGSGATPKLDSEMFGPLFGDRGRTNGRRKLSATLTVQFLKWATLDGSEVRLNKSGLLWGDDGYLVDEGVAYGYVGRCLMNIDSVVTSLFLTYGISDRLDVTFGAPLVHTSVEGSNEFLDYARFADGSLSVDPADTGFTPQGRFFVKGSSTGIGDISVGATYSFVKQPGTAIALMARANLGTGDYEKMTGTGETQLVGGIVGSIERGPVAPHFSLAYLGANETLFDELRSVLGVDVRAIPNRLTLSAEFLSRRLNDVQGFVANATFGQVTSPVTGDTFDVRNFTAQRNDYNLYFVNFGGKARVTGQLLGTAYVLIPWGNSGLIAQKPSFNFGLNYAF